MSRLMKALIADNQPAPLGAYNVVTTYRNIGDAINAVVANTTLTDIEGDEVNIASYAGPYDGVWPNDDVFDGGQVYQIGFNDCDVCAGYVCVWLLNNGKTVYTAEPV